MFLLANWPTCTPGDQTVSTSDVLRDVCFEAGIGVSVAGITWNNTCVHTLHTVRQRGMHRICRMSLSKMSNWRMVRNTEGFDRTSIT
eukprot:3380512-Pyramimonas_sp.AAC.1